MTGLRRRRAAGSDRTRVGLGPRQRRGDPPPDVTTTTLHQTQDTVRDHGGLFSSHHCRVNAALYFVPMSARMISWRTTATGTDANATTVRTSLNA